MTLTIEGLPKPLTGSGAMIPGRHGAGLADPHGTRVFPGEVNG